jgi:hypothetical protein
MSSISNPISLYSLTSKPNTSHIESLNLMKLVKLSSVKTCPHPVPSPLNGEKVRMRGETSGKLSPRHFIGCLSRSRGDWALNACPESFRGWMLPRIHGKNSQNYSRLEPLNCGWLSRSERLAFNPGITSCFSFSPGRFEPFGKRRKESGEAGSPRGRASGSERVNARMRAGFNNVLSFKSDLRLFDALKKMFSRLRGESLDRFTSRHFIECWMFPPVSSFAL